VVYCEDCLANRIGDTIPAGAVPAAGFAATATPAGAPVPVVVSSGPSPGLAGVLAGFFPFGVGQVYTGQYAKGLAHLLIFTALVFGASTSNSDQMGAVFGLSIAFFYVYQIIDAVRSAKALQMGVAPPDPFGLARTFGTGEKTPDVRQIPIGAVILIGLGILFLFDTLGIFRFRAIGHFWPVILIVLGVWMLMKRMRPPQAGNTDVQGGE
jgi:TM2 domain-containing membrane protein YozV